MIEEVKLTNDQRLFLKNIAPINACAAMYYIILSEFDEMDTSAIQKEVHRKLDPIYDLNLFKDQVKSWYNRSKNKPDLISAATDQLRQWKVLTKDGSGIHRITKNASQIINLKIRKKKFLDLNKFSEIVDFFDETLKDRSEEELAELEKIRCFNKICEEEKERIFDLQTNVGELCLEGTNKIQSASSQRELDLIYQEVCQNIIIETTQFLCCNWKNKTILNPE